MSDKKTDNTPITITFTIDPALRLNTQGERAMAVSVVARRGDVGQVSRFDMSNWKTDLPAEVDRLMRLLLGGSLTLPDFPDMSRTTLPVEKPPASEDISEGIEMSEQNGDQEAAEPEPSASLEGDEDYDISLYPAANDEDGSPSQPGLFQVL